MKKEKKHIYYKIYTFSPKDTEAFGKTLNNDVKQYD